MQTTSRPRSAVQGKEKYARLVSGALGRVGGAQSGEGEGYACVEVLLPWGPAAHCDPLADCCKHGDPRHQPCPWKSVGKFRIQGDIGFSLSLRGKSMLSMS